MPDRKHDALPRSEEETQGSVDPIDEDVAAQSTLTAPGASFEEFYRSSYPAMVRMSYGILRDRDLAEEIVSTTFVKFYPRWSESAITDPDAYLKRSVLNEIRSSWRARARKALFRGEGPSPAEEAIRIVEADPLWSALGRLSKAMRTVLVLRFYADQDLNSIADLTQMPLGTVKSHLSRGLAALRKEIGEYSDE